MRGRRLDALKWESQGEICTSDSFLEAERTDKQRGIFVTVPVSILKAAGALTFG